MELLSGVLPVAPTVFAEDESLDLDGQRRVVDLLIDGEVDAICVLANFSEQFSLDDAERMAVMSAVLDQAGGRVPIAVTTSHFSARIAAERCRTAEAAGASMVMLMPPFFGTTVRVGEEGVLEYFKRVADGLSIDVMIQDAPMSATPLPVPLLARIAHEVPQVRYAKIEVPQAAEKLRLLSRAAGEDLPGLFDGEEAVTLIPDLDAGAIGTMSSVIAAAELGRVVRDYAAGRREAAVSAWEELLPLVHFENRQVGLRASKILLQEAGVIASDRARAPLPDVSPETRTQLVDLARRKSPFLLSWAR
ncbi:dihydrodipicolinate synthase family protein [Naasia sp. SYSU D00948]|uniref:dihydrodipicolinate synthase family protein n=1 Tax=Naasia sp. SYSU D00948 TaxID=2817379 RepID=UPI001B304DD0|nr:dihydrodipicolinate synthase family protein [Naasia sp. SYSU D00948]